MKTFTPVQKDTIEPTLADRLYEMGQVAQQAVARLVVGNEFACGHKSAVMFGLEVDSREYDMFLGWFMAMTEDMVFVIDSNNIIISVD